MWPDASMEASAEDVDEQLLILFVGIFESARLAKIPVEVRLVGRESLAGVPRSLSTRWGETALERWRLFDLDGRVIDLDQVSGCTVPARPGTPRPAAADVASLDRWGPSSNGNESDCSPPSPSPMTLQVTLAAGAEAPALARLLTECLLSQSPGVSPPRSELAAWIARELVANVALHAYEADHIGEASLELAVSSGLVTILVSDDGRGPRAASPANRTAGTGWKLIAQRSDYFSITERGGGGTLVEVQLKL
jgi:anti-sigma regulatory factor (Ser/Thr protein kinase)